MSPRARALGRYAAIFAAWTAFGLLIAVQTWLQLRLRGETRPLWSVVAPPLVGSWLWALYTPPIFALVARLRRLREGDVPAWRGWTLYLAAHLAVAAFGTVADSAVCATVRPLIDGTVIPWERAFAVTLLTNVASYVAVVPCAGAAGYAARFRERGRAAATLARRAEQLQGKLDEARLHALEAQLRPHFLYNTLNLIAELVHAEPDVADDMLTHLGLLLRRTYRDGPHLVPLGEELAFVRAYAAILGRRYRDRVMVTVDVPAALEGHPVPSYSLQPLVENAFRHGVERRERPTAVEISAAARDGTLVLRVRDRALGGRLVAPEAEPDAEPERAPESAA